MLDLCIIFNVQTPLLTTKLEFPLHRANHVPRPRLVERLNSNLYDEGVFVRKLTLVSAPAGYGKTTLLAEWLAQNVTANQVLPKADTIAWLSLDEGDNDPKLFLKYLIAAIKGIHKGFGDSLDEILASPQGPPQEVILVALVNELAGAASPTILVLDDYHVIQTPAIHQQLSFILDHMPHRMHLVVVTREDPLLPIPRLRAQGTIVEIRQDDLRFTGKEAAEFLERVMNLALSPEDMAALENRTEGWIAGLQLAALSMQGREDLKGFVQAFAGSSRFILDYLMEEVFERQSPKVQDFLLKTSILRRLSASLCNEVTQRTDSQGVLESLEGANLFIVGLDQTRQWYRYHRLFAELLRHRLRATGSEKILHQRACQWYEHQGLIDEAIQHTLAGEDWENAARLINQAADGKLKRGELVTLVGWCRQVPQEHIRMHPDFGLSYAWGLLLQGEFEEAESLLAYFEQIGQNAPPLMGLVATAQAYAARATGDNQRVIEKSELALSLLPENEQTSRTILAVNLGLVYWHEGKLREVVPVLNEAQELAVQVSNDYANLTARIFLARTLISQGILRRPEEMLRATLETGGQIPILTLAHYDLAGIYYEWNDLDKAWGHLKLGMEMCTRSRNIEFQNGGHLFKTFLLLAQGDISGALASVETTHTLSREFGPITLARSNACHGLVALRMGDISAARHWFEQTAENADAHSFYRFIGLNQPRLLLAEGAKKEAATVLEKLLDQAVQAGWGYAEIAIRGLQAAAAPSKTAGLEKLKAALELSQPEGFIRTYVDTGTALIPLLQEAARQGIMPEYIGQILNGFDGQLKTGEGLILVEPLSPRELEVLRLVTAGLSNREIAQQLVVSLGTAKTHIHNIYGKLEVSNRAQAIARARELHLI